MSTLRVTHLKNETSSSNNITLDSSGRVGVANSTPGSLDAFGDDLVIGDGSGHRGTTIYSGTGSQGVIYFADGTTGGDVARGKVFYSHSDNYLAFDTDATERMRIDSSGNLRFNSGYGSVATAYGVRAWCNADLTGSGSIRGSGNVSSLGDQGTGRWQFSFTTSMPDTNYAAVGLQKPNADVVNITGLHPNSGTFDTYTTALVAFVYANAGGALIDPLIGNLVVLR